MSRDISLQPALPPRREPLLMVQCPNCPHVVTAQSRPALDQAMADHLSYSLAIRRAFSALS